MRIGRTSDCRFFINWCMFLGSAARAPKTAAAIGTITAGTLLLAGILAYAPWDGHDPHSGDWPLAALPALLGDAFAQVMWLVTLTPTGSIDDSFEFNGANGIDTFQISGRTYAAVAVYLDDSVRILDITNPANVTATGHIDDSEGTLMLDGASGIDTFQISGRTYAAVAAYLDDGVQILDITNPANVTATGHIDDSEGTLMLDGASSIAIFNMSGRTYAAVAAYLDDGVQILDITNPANVTATGHIDDYEGTLEIGGAYSGGTSKVPSGSADVVGPLKLGGAYGIDTFQISGRTYAAVAAYLDDGVQILDITNPANVTATDHIDDYEGTLELGGVYGIDTFQISGRTYAAVAAYDDDGVQILDITNPANVTATDHIDDSEGTLELGGAYGIDTFQISGRTYAAVGAYLDDGVQILDITNPANVTATDHIDDSEGTLELGGASGIDTFQISGRTYAAVAAYDDDGVQILRLGPPTNQPPAVAAGPGQTVAEGSTITLDGAASDPDGDPLTYRWTHNSTIPIALGDDASAGTTFAAPRVPSDATIAFTLTATDHHNATASDTTLVTVADDPPVLGAIGNRTIDEGLLLEFAVSATDDDVPAGDLSYAVSGLPEGAAWDPSTRTFGWTPTEAQGPGTYRPSFTVSDGAGGTGSQTVYITVREVNVPPVLGAIGNRTIDEGLLLEFAVNATDDDVPAGDLSYAVSGLPEGAAWDPSTRTFGWTPTEAQGPGTYRPSFTVSDGAGGTGSETVYITVEEVNDPPVADAGADRTASADEEVVLAGAASDPDEDPLTYLWRQTAGSPAVALANHDTLSPSFTAPRVTANTTLAFSLTVGDGLHNSTDTVLVAVGVPDDSHFVTTWRTTAPGESITIPVGGASGAYTVDWGDGTISEGVSGDQTHEYGDAGTHTIRVYGGFERIYLEGDTRNAAKLLSIEQWGDIRWASMGHAFSWASNMVYRATDTPDLSGVTDMSYMFSRASSFNGDISSWDVSQVTDMSDMFVGASSFNRPLNDWDVSQVTAMPYMFSSASSFNQPLSSWDVSSVADMRGMFYQASSFNQPLNDWDVSSATDMFHMFWGASSFNRPLNAWDVSSVADMSGMFWGASSFNRPLNDWDVSSVTDMSAMFHQASSFNQPLNAWDVSYVTDMSAMFRQAASFNQPVSAWDVSQVTDMSAMFHQASSFNQPLSPWDVSQVTDMHYMFLGASSFNQPLSPWDVSSVTDMSHMFRDASSFGQNLGGWYIVPDRTTVDATSAPGTVAAISTQSTFLDRQNPSYGIGTGGDSASFSMNGADLVMDVVPTKRTYAVNIASTGDFGTNNHILLEISVTGLSPNRPPVADAGEHQSVQSGAAVTLDGTGSGDPDRGTTLTYEWSQTSGAAVTLSNATAAEPTFTAPAGPAILIFELSVTDGSLSSTDAVNVTVAAPANHMPVADAGEHQTVQSGDTVTLDGTGSSDPDAGDALSYMWRQTSGDTVTLSNSTIPSPTFAAPAGPAILIFELRVTDGSLSSTDAVNVTVAAPANRMPVADAGDDQDVNEGDTVTLDGTGSGDPDRGTTLTYEWSQTSGAAVTLSNATAAEPTFTAPAGPAILIFELSVTDGSLSSTDAVNVTVVAPANRMPVADAGDDQDVNEGDTVTLDGTGSGDPDDDPLSYMWSQTSGDTVTLSNSSAASPTFAAPAGPAILMFELSVTDGSLSSTDAVNVTVAAPANSPPVLGQIGNMTIDEGSELSFMVSAADANPGDTPTYSISGAPPGAAFDPATGEFSWIPAEAQGPGSYMVTFGATDGLDAADPRTITITVNEANQAPRFGSGLAEGYNCNAAVNGTVTLDFAVTDPDLPEQTLAVTDGSSGDVAYSAEVVDGILQFSAAIVETDGQPFPYDHRLLFYIVVEDDHDPPGRDYVTIRVYLPEAGEPQWPGC